MTWQARIEVDPEVLAGKPVVRGTRLAVEFLLEQLAGGRTVADLAEDYPGITHEDILACLAYASFLVQECRGYAVPA